MEGGRGGGGAGDWGGGGGGAEREGRENCTMDTSFGADITRPFR